MQIIVQKLLTYYEIHGKGRPLVVLHGWGSNLNSFAMILPELSKKYKIYLLDLPGFGKTQAPKTDWHVADYVLFVEEFLEKFNLHKSHFLGHSFGARVLIKLAAQKPELCEKLILTGAAGIKPSKTLKQHLLKAIAKTGKLFLSVPLLKKLKPYFQKKLYQFNGSDDYLQAGNLRQTFLNIINEDLTPFLNLIITPTLLIWGENDQDTPLSDAKKMQKIIPHSQLKIIPGAGHYAFIDQPRQFLALLN